ncbi:MAG: adenosylcobinamide-phosphate synthase CbiB [Paraglaciecola sp.]|uniref:adenosylcobinamide-phosphate synthase CbiB n=1 Tax=Paraglaciecola sp. TaxID=1920173 RepID=UPI0032976782
MNDWLITALQIAAALLLDKILGEPNRWHPLVGFGNIAKLLEKKTNNSHQGKGRFIGSCCCLVLVLPIPILLFFLQANTPLFWALETFILYLAIAQHSLAAHAQQIYYPLKHNDLPKARYFTGFMVSRDTQQLSKQQMIRATVESVLENGHDGVIASVFYFTIGGAPWVVLHRLINTLDAMWGYKNSRFLHFGWCAAKLDDLLGFFSACTSCLMYGLQARPVSKVASILRCAWRQSQQYKSKNGGLCMSVGAQVLNFKIGGDATYHGKPVIGVTLGAKRQVILSDIPASIKLVKQASALWLLCILILGILCQIL